MAALPLDDDGIAVLTGDPIECPDCCGGCAGDICDPTLPTVLRLTLVEDFPGGATMEIDVTLQSRPTDALCDPTPVNMPCAYVGTGFNGGLITYAVGIYPGATDTYMYVDYVSGGLPYRQTGEQTATVDSFACGGGNILASGSFVNATSQGPCLAAPNTNNYLWTLANPP